MTARLSRTGLSPKESAMLGSAVFMIVVSRFCMKSAQATISGTTIEFGRSRWSHEFATL